MTTNNGQPQKRITITNTSQGRWTIDFEGVVTNRDIKKLQRILLVEFAKVQRRRSVAKLMAVQKPVNPTEPTEPSEPSEPSEPTNASNKQTSTAENKTTEAPGVIGSTTPNPGLKLYKSKLEQKTST